MPKCLLPQTTQPRRLLALGRTGVLIAVTWLVSRLRSDCPVPIEVLISSFWMRWSVDRRLRHAVRRLQRILPQLSLNMAIVAQQTIVTDHQLLGCYQISQRPDGSRFALIRLSLEVDGRCISTDEMLAVLAEQYITLAMQSTGPGLLVPIDLDLSPQPDPLHRARLQPDPLAAINRTGNHIA
ncbi:MAG TPA: hypothetical protein VFB58_04850 [Chloroflexota bacterium]|nr:hypothetical protein [Chloroflexota bacterium]